MSPSDLKEEFTQKRIQQIEVDQDGTILASDDVLFSIKGVANISNLHPFFEGLQYLLEDLKEHIAIPCVNIALQNTNKIIDVEIIKRDNRYFLLLFDFTQHYEDAHPLVQEKNEAGIAKEQLAFDKRLLLAKEAFKNTFLANLNHEIRNPLNNMLGFMELLRDTKLTYDQNETLKVMHRTGTQIKQLMDDMLDISKIERGVIRVQKVAFNLGHILANLQRHYLLKLSSKKVSVQLLIDDDIPKKLIGDPVRINQILFNLLENASKYTLDGMVTLHVSVKELKGKDCVLSFTVTNTGEDIPASELNKIFDSYYQLKESSIEPLGEGLGLKIVKDLVELLHGKVSVESENSETVFTCVLPFEVRTAKEKRPTVPKGSGILISKRILVLEDDETSQMLLMRTFLNNECGYILEIANSAEHAFVLLEKKSYDLIIIKNKLPDSPAHTFITSCNTHTSEQIAEMPILVASGSTMLQQQQSLLEAGASGFLAKPYTQKELFDTIEKLLP
ncbi:response regulator [Rasiella rasia]|uniref:histidine kinase n=1 Tax=Rasiella rasia TaxID=2744027 RepID=A0A6G6GML9_9FLAO|nr:hybrid sensor histidine kinase/response regulator [Rasiella rasia]QIE59767.1 response regulator [Rasiella rasia]